MSDLEKVHEDKTKILSAVLIRGDLAQLSEIEKLSHLKSVCDSLGLNPLTHPFKYIQMNGKLVLYAGRDATDQLRKIHNVSLEIISREVLGDCYVVTARAKMPNGRIDESIGAVYLGKLSSDALANSYMKAETKAKRRVTLSICGLGMLDETEVETISEGKLIPKYLVGGMGTSHYDLPEQIGNRAQDALKIAREKVYELANRSGVNNEMMRTIIFDRYKKESSIKLNLSELEDLGKFLSEK